PGRATTLHARPPPVYGYLSRHDPDVLRQPRVRGVHEPAEPLPHGADCELDPGGQHATLVRHVVAGEDFSTRLRDSSARADCAATGLLRVLKPHYSQTFYRAFWFDAGVRIARLLGNTGARRLARMLA